MAAGGHDRINVQNNPVNAIDPYGENTIAIGAGGGFAVGGPVGAVIGAIGGAIGGYLIYDKVVKPYLESKKSGKEKANDIPSWAEGLKPSPDESGKDFSKRILDEKYGKDNYPTGPGSEYNKIKKYGDRCK